MSVLQHVDLQALGELAVTLATIVGAGRLTLRAMKRRIDRLSAGVYDLRTDVKELRADLNLPRRRNNTPVNAIETVKKPPRDPR